MKVPVVTTILCSALILAWPGMTHATLLDTVEIEHTDYGASDVAQVWGGGLEGALTGSGVYRLTKTDSTGQGNIWSNGQLGGFCMELNQESPESDYLYQVNSLAEATISFTGESVGDIRADYLRELWGRFYNPDWNTPGSHSYLQDTQARALAAAIWEIIYEEIPESALDWDVSVDGLEGAGGFRCYNVNADMANGFLHALDGTGPKAELMVFTNDLRQDYIVQVPEPATLVLLGLGVIAGPLRRRRTAS